METIVAGSKTVARARIKMHFQQHAQPTMCVCCKLTDARMTSTDLVAS